MIEINPLDCVSRWNSSYLGGYLRTRDTNLARRSLIGVDTKWFVFVVVVDLVRSYSPVSIGRGSGKFFRCPT